MAKGAHRTANVTVLSGMPFCRNTSGTAGLGVTVPLVRYLVRPLTTDLQKRFARKR